MNKEQTAYHKGQADECVRILCILDKLDDEGCNNLSYAAAQIKEETSQYK